MHFRFWALSTRATHWLSGRPAAGTPWCDRQAKRSIGHALAIGVENLAGIYLAACALGEPPLLAADEMQRVLERFRTYGPRAAGRASG
jgi:L-fuculose-phosphate aldolase